MSERHIVVKDVLKWISFCFCGASVHIDVTNVVSVN